MKTYEYTIYLSAPLVLTTSSADENTMQSRDYIPGNVLLGALAGQHRQMTSSEGQFYDFFLSDEVRFCNAFVSEDGKMAIPSPMAIHKEKAKENYFFFPAMTEKDKTEHPSTKSLPGYISIEGNQIRKHSVEKGLHFHINTEKKNEEDDARIFHYEFIKRGQTFKGFIKCSEELSEDFEAFLNQIRTLRLGRSKNTEYGKVQFSYKAADSEINPKPYGDQITLFFKSPVILKNENGYYEPSDKLLKKELAFSDDVEIIHKFFRTESFENFRSIWGIKMPSTTAYKTGCTFTLNFKQGVTEAHEQRLAEILNDGIGYRKNEGFGEVSQLDLKTAELTLAAKEKVARKLSKPEKKPEFMKNVLKQITLKTIEQVVDEKVMVDAATFKRNIPSNSLLSKIDLMVKDSDSFDSFTNTKVLKLREHAQKQLKKCRNNSIKLFDLLTDEKHIQFHFDNEKGYLPQIEEKANSFEYQKRYISGLMRRLRKINKDKKDGDN